jgi:hypothetical protein
MESLDSNMIRESASFINAEIKNYLAETAKWGKFLAIVGYFGIGLILIIAVGVMVMGSGFLAHSWRKYEHGDIWNNIYRPRGILFFSGILSAPVLIENQARTNLPGCSEYYLGISKFEISL